MENLKIKKEENLNKKKEIIREIVEWFLCIIVAVVLALLVRYFIGTPTIVQHPSMTPTLLSGERLLLNRLEIKLGGNLDRGDIITFEAPSKTFVPSYEVIENNYTAEYNYNINGLFDKFVYYVLELTKTSYIKRIIAFEGEHIKIEDGKVYINGEILEEGYLPEGTETMSANGYFVDLIVPEGTVFVMGDNRGNSTDSRNFGCIPIEKIESKVLIRFWPLNKFGVVE